MSFTHFSIGLSIFSISLYTGEISPLSVKRVASVVSSLSLDFVDLGFFPC